MTAIQLAQGNIQPEVSRIQTLRLHTHTHRHQIVPGLETRARISINKAGRAHNKTQITIVKHNRPRCERVHACTICTDTIYTRPTPVAHCGLGEGKAHKGDALGRGKRPPYGNLPLNTAIASPPSAPIALLLDFLVPVHSTGPVHFCLACDVNNLTHGYPTYETRQGSCQGAWHIITRASQAVTCKNSRETNGNSRSGAEIGSPHTLKRNQLGMPNTEGSSPNSILP